jgi:hypothetical protein
VNAYIVLQAPTKGGGRIPGTRSKDLVQPLEWLKSEQLPVVEGDLYGMYAVMMQQYPYDEVKACA